MTPWRVTGSTVLCFESYYFMKHKIIFIFVVSYSFFLSLSPIYVCQHTKTATEMKDLWHKV
jgi:hypothetical protein